MSLKQALERLLGAPCYHMHELLTHPEHAPTWRDAMHVRLPDREAFLDGYAAIVDDPASRFWRELAAAHPEAPVLLPRRDSARTWYRSMDATVLRLARELRAARDGATGRVSTIPWRWPEEAGSEELLALDEMFAGMGGAVFGAPDERDALIAEYERHLAEVRAAIPAERLVEWQPGDGWQPPCDALAVPDEPFPHRNGTVEFSAHAERACR